MNQIGTVYGEALYSLAAEVQAEDAILQQLQVLQSSFSAEPQFLQLLTSPALAKAERCQILDDSFRGKVEPYLLNFLKLLTEKGYIGHFSACCDAYTDKYNQQHNILPVTAVTLTPLSLHQSQALTDKLSSMTGKKVSLTNRIDPDCFGGIRLDYDGNRLDDTVAHRLEQVRQLLKNTVL